MASKSGAVWAIDIGTNSMKALRLQVTENRVEVIDFDNIEHGRILAGPEITAEEMNEVVTATLHEFVGRHGLSKDEVIISIPGQNSFARFIKLPPVEPKRIPEIIQFEAIQQIPFDINDVEWDWQLMGKPESAGVEVGIFAIKNELINAALEPFNRENVKVSFVQMAPMALYNYVFYDRKEVGETSTSSDESGNKKALIVLDMGAENTDLVICTRTSVWQRCIPLGGNAFTRAVADTFKLDFEKAEKLKRTAPMSKYARQIFQAMKPVFTDFGAEIQRSLGFYKSARRQTSFSKAIILGGGMKLQGIGKFLQQSLQLPMIKLDSFEKLTVSSTVSAAKFHENVSDFGVVYGLALQGLGQGRIESNLLPRKVARAVLWARKAKYLTAAAAVFLVVCMACLARGIYDQRRYQSNENIRKKVAGIINTAEIANKKLQEEKKLDSQHEAVIEKQLELFKYRNVIPLLCQTVIFCLPNAESNPEQAELYKAFSSSDIEGIKQFRRDERKQIFVTSLSVNYAQDVVQAQFSDVTRSPLMRTVPGMPGGPGAVGGRIAPGMPGGGGVPGAMGGGRTPTRSRRSRRRREDVEESESEDTTAGFVITIEGYSPFEKISELLDPVGVSKTSSKWGVVTRLMNLDKMFYCEGCGKIMLSQKPEKCPNCRDELLKAVPFELFEKTSITHFRLETGEVEMGSLEMPEGIGLEQDADASESQGKDEGRALKRAWTMGPARKARTLLVDPMTGEIISKVVEIDENGSEKYDVFGNPLYEVNDHWFRIQAKLVWKEKQQQEKTEEKAKTSSKRKRRSRRR